MTRAGLLLTAGLAAGLSSGCVYYNAMYNANAEYAKAREQSAANSTASARVSYDSVIAKTSRILANHPDSKWADDAALLKSRSELARELWPAAAASADRARTTAGDSALWHAAAGLAGVARGRLQEYAAADSLLSAALNGDLESEDRAYFLYSRGQARLALGRPAEAAADLRSAVSAVALSADAGLDLSRALVGTGDYAEAAGIIAEVLATDPAPAANAPLRAQVDTLTRLAPRDVSSALAAKLESPTLTGARRSLHLLLRGNASSTAGDEAAALSQYEASIEAAPRTQAGAEAAYHVARLRTRNAATAGEISEQLGNLQTAQALGGPKIRQPALALSESVGLFDDLIGAHSSRGSGAAEALLRAAEVASEQIGARRVARSLYEQYVQETPPPAWRSKAILAALTLPEAEGAAEAGSLTNAQLRQLLSGLPQDDPYVRASSRISDTRSDSAYSAAEVALAARIRQIRGLFDPSALEQPTDSLPNPSDTTNVEGQEPELAN
ncbi:MAG: tetratricopeptide repeat protein [Gemmatimonadota bacterium]